jgi:predicted transposase/invertase (TIGR01784 family)
VTQLVERVQTEVASDLERRKVIDLIETIVLYKLPNLSQEELAAMFAIDDLRQTRFAREMKAEGREEGDRERQRMVISRLFSRDFPIEDIAQIVDLSVEEVREIVAQIQADLQD